MRISKSNYIVAKQCHKALWLYKHKPQLQDTPSSQTESNFEKGIQVGEVAKELFPHGEEIEFDSSNFKRMIERTKKLISDGTEIIYEATFS